MDKVVQNGRDRYEQNQLVITGEAELVTHPSCRELKYAPGWDGGCV